MTRGVADIVEVVVLAAGADAFLRRRGPDIGTLLDAGEDILELHHAGVGEHERRIVARHERARRNDRVSGLAEELEEVRSNVVDAAHEQGSPEMEGCPARSRTRPLKAPMGERLKIATRRPAPGATRKTSWVGRPWSRPGLAGNAGLG